jgi:hypothetical protein
LKELNEAYTTSSSLHRDAAFVVETSQFASDASDEELTTS